MNDDDKLAQAVNYGDLVIDENGDIVRGGGDPWWLAAAIGGMAGRREREEIITKTIAPMPASDGGLDDDVEWVFNNGVAVYGMESSFDVHEGVPVPAKEHRARAALSAYYERVDFDPVLCGRAAGRYNARQERKARK